MQITPHVQLKNGEGTETQIIAEAFLIVPVTSLDLAVMSWGSQTDKYFLAPNEEKQMECIARMNNIRSIAKEVMNIELIFHKKSAML